MKKGFTLIELLIVVAIIAILAAIAVPNFLEAQVRSKVSRCKADMRSFATGIESYYVDNNTYPLAASGLGGSAPTGVSRDATGAGNINQYLVTNGTTNTPLKNLYTFAARGTQNVAIITTPIAYLTTFFPDPFMDAKGATFAYYTDTNGWIMWTPGPDGDQATVTELGQQNPPNVETVYVSTVSQPSTVLVAGASAGANSPSYTYDPTNGTVSPGDVWRVKQ
jgi:prepilin-type N-terminal cleavage/methylation domain-containing protein